MDELIAYKVLNQRWHTVHDMKHFNRNPISIVKVDIIVQADTSISLLLRWFDSKQIRNVNNPAAIAMITNTIHRQQLRTYSSSLPFIDMYETDLLSGTHRLYLPKHDIDFYDFDHDWAYGGVIYVGFLTKTRDPIQVWIQEKPRTLLETLGFQTINKVEWLAKPDIRLENGMYFTPFFRNKRSMHVCEEFLKQFDVRYSIPGGTHDVKLLRGCTTIYDKRTLRPAYIERVPLSYVVDKDSIWIDTQYALYRHEAKMRAQKMHDSIQKELIEWHWHPARVLKMIANDINALDDIDQNTI